MRWSDLEILRAILDAGTLAGAARSLNIDQTTAARRLAAVEKRLGQKAFDRVEGRLSPTPMLQAAQAGIDIIATAVINVSAALSREAVALQGRVTVSCLGFYAKLKLAPCLGALYDRHPGVALDLVLEDRLANLMEREADIAIRFAWPEDDRAIMRKIDVVRFRRFRAIAANGEHPPVISYGARLRNVPEMELLRRLRPDGGVVLRADRLDVLAEAAVAIGADVMLPEMIGDAMNEFKRADAEDIFAQRDVFLLIHPDRRHAPPVAATVDWLMATAAHSAAQPWTEGYVAAGPGGNTVRQLLAGS